MADGGLGRGGRAAAIRRAIESLPKRPETLGRGAVYAAQVAKLLNASSVVEDPQLLKPTPVPMSPTVFPTTPVSTSGQYKGRGARREETQQPCATTAHPPSPLASTQKTGARMRGKDGKHVNMTSNYIRLKVAPGKSSFEYHVVFDPQIDSLSFRIQLVRRQEHVLGSAQVFDGEKLYLPFRLQETTAILTGEHPVDSAPVSIYLNFVAEHKHGEGSGNIHLYNVLFKRVMNALKMTKVGRNYFSPEGSIPVPRHKLQVWPGYVTHVDNYEGGVMLVTDVAHRVLQTATVRDFLADIRIMHPNEFKDMAIKRVVGNVVLTRYNNKTYRIDEIAWDENPQSTFVDSHGNAVRYMDYYKSKYNINILDDTQPLLIHRQKPRKGQPEQPSRLLALIPELSFITGLTDDMRHDFRVMKDLAVHTRLTPMQRQHSYNHFLKNVESCPAAKEYLASWGLALDTTTVKLDGRICVSEAIYYGNRRVGSAGNEGDWSRDLAFNQVITGVPLHSWCVICHQKDSRKVNEFIRMLRRVYPQMGMDCSQPNVVELQDERNDSYLSAIREFREQIQIFVIVCPTARDDRYSAIKKVCTVDNAIPSQVINAKTISQATKLRSVTQNVALQMNAKLGGELWAVSIPLSSLMVVGIDVYHDTVRRGRSVLGFVSSVNQTMTQWFSRAVYQEPRQEIADSLTVLSVGALKKYKSIRGTLPKHIVVYRDGVSDGQLDILEHEVTQLLSSFSAFPGYKPKLTVIVVQKRITARLFTAGPQSQLGNPPPGTVMDHTITRRQYANFLLVSQHVRQGTVTPTRYTVLYDNSNFSPDHCQRLTYKLTHLYYNWPGTIRVPAPVQYAHKLAQLVGQSLHKPAHSALEDRLFYL